MGKKILTKMCCHHLLLFSSCRFRLSPTSESHHPKLKDPSFFLSFPQLTQCLNRSSSARYRITGTRPGLSPAPFLLPLRQGASPGEQENDQGLHFLLSFYNLSRQGTSSDWTTV
jgi:hypothetical protein